MRLHKTFFSATLLVALAGTALAQAGRSIHVDLKETRLANGLRVITVEDHSAPVIAVNVTYNVGSRNEKQGRTGFAHLFEHMMFQGSENVGKSEHFILIQNSGGQMNGTTNEDRTNYFEALPANQIELALYLESDRMRSLEVNQTNLDNQRNVVQEERRIGLEPAQRGAGRAAHRIGQRTLRQKRRDPAGVDVRQLCLQARHDWFDGRFERGVG